MISSKRILMLGTILGLLVFSAIGIAGAQDEETAWLGISLLDTEDGVTIGRVLSDSPAESAGLQRGDIITAVDGNGVESASDVVRIIGTHAPGDEVIITVTSDGETRDVTAALARRPADSELLGPASDFDFAFSGPHSMMLGALGLETALTDEGLEINAISDNSALADSGFQAGDVITEINGQSVLEPGMGVMQSFRFDQPLVFTVLRGGEEVEVEVDPSVLRNMMPMIEAVPGQPGMMFGFGAGQGRPTQLGVQFRTLSADVAADEGLSVEQGALVVEVFEDTPAAQAGLQADDVITAVDGDVVDEERTLTDRLYAYEEGDVVTLSVLRDGDELELEVTLGPRMMMQGQFFQDPQGGMRGPQGGMMNPRGGMMNPRGGMFHDRQGFGPGRFLDRDHMHEFLRQHGFWGKRGGQQSQDDTQTQPQSTTEPTPEGPSA